MKIFKAIFMNPLVLATLITILASTILVAYSEHRFRAGGEVARTALRAADGLSSNPSASPAPRQVDAPFRADAAHKKGAERPAVIVWGIQIPGGSYIDSML